MSAKPKPGPVAKRTPSPARPEPTRDEIALCAQSIWEEEGRPHGRDLEHWLRAETRLRQGSQSEGATGGPPRRTGRSGSKRRQPGS
ncbi:MAG: hypothetical protein RL514_2918 [Verrucomicrobiota bacterium]|jgi:hypothetical protein